MNGKRIVSLSPGGAEIVCALGRGGQLVGRSVACDFPSEVASLPVCSSAEGTLDAEKVRQLRPDIILTSADLAEASGLPASGPQILRLSAIRLAAIWTDIQAIADALGAVEQGRELLSTLKNRVVDVIQKTCVLKKRPSVACLECLDPMMAAGNWVPELVELAGGADVLGAPGQPARTVEWTTLAQSDPDFLLLMLCGFDLERTRRAEGELKTQPGWKKLSAVKSGHVVAVDGLHYFNRPGPRIVDSLEMLAEILHPQLFSFGHAARASAPAEET